MINQIKKIKKWLPQVASFLFVWLALWIININWSRDRQSYIDNLRDAKALSLLERLTQMNWLNEPGYFLIQNLAANTLSYAVIIGLVVFICLALKYSALTKIVSKSGWLMVIPYLAILSYLHEGTQIRTALALSVCLWAVVFWIKDHYWPAVFLIIAAAFFHVSALTFLFIFGLIGLYRRFGVIFYWLALGIALLLAIPGVSSTLLFAVGELTNARYLNYARGAIFRTLNVTGLFQFFFLFPALLGILIWRLGKPREKTEDRIRELALVCAACAVAVLQDFRFNTVIASRIADLLLLPVCIALGFLLNQLYLNQNKTKFWIIILIVLSYCVMRGYVSFSERPPPLMPTVD